MGDFHFLRPWWLALLPVAAWLMWLLVRGRDEGGGWRDLVDAPLRAHVLAEPEVLRSSRWPLLAALASAAVALAALAGPTWERLPVPAFRSEEALVVALDLSRSMDAGDVEPSRLSRARLKVLDLLERRAAGQTALVVFSTHAFTVTPLTTDTRTISSLVGAVSTSIMPTQGSSLASGLAKAASLLRQTGLRAGDVLAITDADTVAADVELAGKLRSEGFTVSVLAVGTEQGAPIPRAEGGFVTDGEGAVVIPQLDVAGLARVAAAGGGRFARLAPDDRDLESLFPTALPGAAQLRSGVDPQQADIWRDRGGWLALALLPLLALCFRRGWLAGFAVVLLLPTPHAHAFEWQDLWQRPDQRGYEALQNQQNERAAQFFKDSQWRGAAQYRAGKFADSATSLAAVDTPDGNYNRGNALAKSGQLEDAIAAYDRALELDPQHADATYNRDLVKDYLAKNPPPQKQNQPQSGEQNQNPDQQGKSNGGSGEEQNGDPQSRDQQSDQDKQASGDSQRDTGQQPQNRPQPGDELATREEQQASAEQNQQGAQGQAAESKDAEHWADEQAAEQWLRRIPQDPGGLLRRKFLYQYQRLGVDQDGKSVANDPRAKPW